MSSRVLSLALALLPLAAAGAQEPATYRLVRFGREPVPIVMSRSDDGRPLLELLEETLVVGPGDRVSRVTVMRAEVYERTPCALLAQLRAMERARETGGDTTTPAAPTDTSAAMCAALRTPRDSTVGTVATEGARKVVRFAPRAGRTPEPPALLVMRGDTLDLHVGASTPNDPGAVVMRYVRTKR